jgi:hypothetical protein
MVLVSVFVGDGFDIHGLAIFHRAAAVYMDVCYVLIIICGKEAGTEYGTVFVLLGN